MKKIKILLIILFILAMIPISINGYIYFSTKDNIFNEEKIKDEYDIALVLGCSVLRDGRPSLMLKDRLNKAVSLYDNGHVKKILVSGDHKDGYSETEVMKRYLMKKDIPEDDILVDEKGYNTKNSIKNFANNYKDSSIIVISQEYHLFRAIYLASKYNLNGIGVYADKNYYNGQFNRNVREFLARFKDFIIK